MHIFLIHFVSAHSFPQNFPLIGAILNFNLVAGGCGGCSFLQQKQKTKNKTKKKRKEKKSNDGTTNTNKCGTYRVRHMLCTLSFFFEVERDTQGIHYRNCFCAGMYVCLYILHICRFFLLCIWFETHWRYPGTVIFISLCWKMLMRALTPFLEKKQNLVSGVVCWWCMLPFFPPPFIWTIIQFLFCSCFLPYIWGGEGCF